MDTLKHKLCVLLDEVAAKDVHMGTVLKTLVVCFDPTMAEPLGVESPAVPEPQPAQKAKEKK